MQPEQPEHLPSPQAGDLPWRWAFLSAAGAEVEVDDEFATQRFANQADAESWVGEVYADLADEGVDAVTLYEADRAVYGPMSLHA